MDAPLYPPAAHFEQPERMPQVLSATFTPIADLKKNPAAWAIVKQEIPAIDAMIGNPMLQVHLGNFSVKDLVQYRMFKPEVIDRLDARLKTLGEVR